MIDVTCARRLRGLDKDVAVYLVARCKCKYKLPSNQVKNYIATRYSYVATIATCYFTTSYGTILYTFEGKYPKFFPNLEPLLVGL